MTSDGERLKIGWGGKFRAKKAIEEFSIKKDIPLLAEPNETDLMFIPEVFFRVYKLSFLETYLDEVSFKNIMNLMKIDSGFFIFQNFYKLYGARGSSPNNLLCFLSTIHPVAGYHRIILHFPRTHLDLALNALLKGKITPQDLIIKQKVFNKLDTKKIDVKYFILPKMTDTAVEEKYYVFSNSPEDTTKILHQIQSPLLQLADRFPKKIYNYIDCVYTNLEIHITDRYMLSRMNWRFAVCLPQLYPLFKTMQQALSKPY